jgi:hypothetical protein
MAQLFQPAATTVFRVAIVVALLGAVGTILVVYLWARADSTWGVGVAAPQPVPFRHDLHAGALRIDCRYCHSGVQRAASAGMPSARTCMSCHAQVWVGADILEPIRSSAALGQAVEWGSVHRLPDHAYFHHGIHVAKGFACETCHGRVDRMATTTKTETLSMGWCLDCHRNQASRRLTDCNACHR